MTTKLDLTEAIKLLRFALETQTADRHDRLAHVGPSFAECSNPVCSNTAWVLRKTDVNHGARYES